MTNGKAQFQLTLNKLFMICEDGQIKEKLQKPVLHINNSPWNL